MAFVWPSDPYEDTKPILEANIHGLIFVGRIAGAFLIIHFATENSVCTGCVHAIGAGTKGLAWKRVGKVGWGTSFCVLSHATI